ncbi:MAG: hypothetical protein AB7I50_01755 [Vicinamibacterales bacterium]
MTPPDSSGVPWVRYRDTQLYAVPSIHSRLVFAQFVLEACARMPFDVIAVELPLSYNSGDTLETIAVMGPYPGFLAQPSKDAGPLVVTPITPADSIVSAVRCPHLLQNQWPSWRPQVVAIDNEFAPARRPPTRFVAPDDYEVRLIGLEAYCRRWRDAWKNGRDEAVDGPREKLMASRLVHFLAQGLSVLFVCGAAHWSPIETLLDQGIAPADSARPRTDRGNVPQRFAARLDPALAWLWGWLDDIPQVVWSFEKAAQAGEPASFDKAACEKTLLRAGIEAARQVDMPLSARALVTMERLYTSRLGLEARWTSQLDPHIVDVARSCVSTKYADFLKLFLCEYPAAPPDGIPEATFDVEGDRVWLVIDGRRFPCRPREGNWDTGRRLPLPVAPKLTPRERALLESKHVYRDSPAEALLHNRLIRHARDVAHAEGHQPRTRRWDGTLGLGLDSRRTIRAMAAGERACFVRHRGPGTLVHAPCDGFCPVVWIFAIDKRIAGHFAGFVPKEAHGHASLCRSAFHWLLGSHTLGDSGIHQFQLAYTVSLTRGLMPIATARTAETIAQLLRRLPTKRLAQVAPWDDPDLRSFDGHEQAIAAAVKYADDHIIVVSIPDMALGAELQAFARERGVQIKRVSRDRFEPSALERLGFDHNVPAASQYEDPFPWCERYMMPVE